MINPGLSRSVRPHSFGWTCGQCRGKLQRRFYSFQHGDSVLLNNATDLSKASFFVQRLDRSRYVQGHNGRISHSDIIGKSPRDTVTSSKNVRFRLARPSLDEHVRLTPRLVTPIYPADANLIVSLLGLHPDPHSDERIEILEAGTGHGGLTLHLARAVHAANAFVPEESVSGDRGDEVKARRNDRKAVVHSIEISKKHSERAQEVVQAFRHGLYARNVEFHVGQIEDFLEQRYSNDNELNLDHSSQMRTPFLTHAILDLPGADRYLDSVAGALKTDGILIVFNPSVTQITGCVQKISDEGIPLQLDQTLELGGGMSGGKEWDVRIARIRAAKTTAVAAPDAAHPPSEGLNGSEAIEMVSDESEDPAKSIQTETISSSSSSTSSQAEKQGWAMVCRPKVGKMVQGGGFVGVFRKKQIA